MIDWQKVWVAGTRGVYVSADGVDWQAIGGNEFKVNAVLRQKDRLVAGCEWGLWEVRRGVERWVQLHDETLTEVQDVAAVAGDPGALAASAYGVAVGARDEQGFVRWTSLSDELQVDQRFSNALLVDPGDEGRWLVGTEAGVLVAANRGAKWETTELAGCPVRALMHALGVFWAGTDDRGLWRSADGMAWTRVGGQVENAIFALAESGGRILAGSLEGVLVGGLDGAWHPVGPRMLVSALAAHPRREDLWLAGASPGGLWRTEDAGASWGQVASFTGVGALLAPKGD